MSTAIRSKAGLRRRTWAGAAGHEPLEHRVLFSVGAGPAEGDALRPGTFDTSGILVRFKQDLPAGLSGRNFLAGTDIDQSPLGLDPHLREVRLGQGVGVKAALAAYQKNPLVDYAEPNWLYTLQATSNDPYYTNGSLWGMYGDATSPTNPYGSQAAEAWAGENTGSNDVYVGIIDEGIQFTHPDLDANVWTNAFDPVNGVDDDGNGYKDDVHGWDFAGNDNTIYDGGKRGNVDKHGTHVAGTIAAEGGNGIGVAGVNWDVTYISGKFLGRMGGTTANAIRAVDYFTDLKTRHGMNIVATNNSWGGGGFSQALLDAISRGASANILFIAAAGNGGSDQVGDNNDTTPSYPSNYDTTAAAGYDAVVAVAAIASDGSKPSWSNYGATTVDLGAPGAGIYSTLPNNTYGAYSGTSMATPHVTGAAALYAAVHRGASAAEIKGAILAATVPTASMSGKTVTGGRLDASGFAGTSEQTGTVSDSGTSEATLTSSSTSSTTSLFSGSTIGSHPDRVDASELLDLLDGRDGAAVV